MSQNRGVGTTGARRAQALYILTRGPFPCYFVSWYLLTKDKLTHMTHEMYKLQILHNES